MGACLYGGYRRKIYPLYSVAYITSSLSKEWERAFLWVSRKIFFYGINFDAAARFALWRWHQNWCHSTKTRFRLSFLVPKRSQAPALSRVWRQNGANLSQNLLPHHYRNLRASKTTFIFETSWKYFVATYLPVRGACVCLTSPFPYSNMEGKKNDILFLTFWKSFSTPVPHGFEAKSKHRAETFPSTPVPQHQKQKSKHCIGTFFLYYLTATWDALKTTSNYSVFKKSLYSLTATSEAKKRHRFLKVFRKVTN